jgi:hypothetical protein
MELLAFAAFGLGLFLLAGALMRLIRKTGHNEGDLHGSNGLTCHYHVPSHPWG